MVSTRGLEPSNSNDEVFDRLRAADPAANLDPDTTALRATISASIAASAAASTTLAPVVDLSARRPRAKWLQVAAVAAGVILVGGGGYAIGTADRSSDQDNSAAISPAQPSFPVGDPAVKDSAGSSSETNQTMAPFGAYRTVFTAVGLDDVGGTAHAWGFDAASAFSAETAAALAKVFGVDGTPTVNYGSWHVGSDDWTASMLDLQPDAQTSFYYSNPLINPWADDSTVQSVDNETAIAALREVMTAAGVDPAGFTFEAQTYEGARETMVTATRVGEPAAAQLAWQASVTSAGISSASGQLAPLVDLGAYDVVGAATAVGRLSDPRFGATSDYPIAYGPERLATDPGAGVSDVPPVEPSVSGGSDSSVTSEPAPSTLGTLPPQAAPGTIFEWPVTSVAITEAALTTTLLMSSDGSSALVPAYRLTGSDGSAWTVIAVTDAHLDFSPS